MIKMHRIDKKSPFITTLNDIIGLLIYLGLLTLFLGETV